MSLAGHYSVHPGAVHSIRGQRPVVGAGYIALMLRGRQRDDGVRLLGMVLTLCAHAQRHTAYLAWVAAQEQQAPAADAHDRILLRLETARDHLRSMALDWPQRLGRTGSANTPQWPKNCPLPLVTPQQAPGPEDAAAQLLQLHEWLEQPSNTAEPLQALLPWQQAADALAPAARTLDVLHTDPAIQGAHLAELARQLRDQPGFAQTPLWKGAPAETGVWTRLRDRSKSVPAQTVLSRLMARWTELKILAAHPQDDTLLQSGAVPLGGGEAIAWCEMARGLLLHWIRLGVDNRVMDYRLLAPTEWNFHPQGALAQALRELPTHDSDRARLLTAAYDPCVECRVEAGQEEVSHA